jgi:hypothetical protein
VSGAHACIIPESPIDVSKTPPKIFGWCG